MSPRALLSSRLLLTMFAVHLASGCETARSASKHPTSGPQAREVVGGRADALVVLRLELAMNDPLYGPLLRDNRRPDIESTVSSIRSIEAWMIADGATARTSSCFLAVHARPPAQATGVWWHAWEKLLNGSTRLPSGTLEYISSVAGMPVALYAYNDGTLLAATGTQVSRLHARARRSAQPPPPTTYEPDAIFAAYIGPRVYELPDVRTSPMSQGVESSWAIVRASARGDMAFSATYDTVKRARAVHDMTVIGMQQYAAVKAEAVRECPPLGQLEVGFERRGRTLSGRLGNLPGVLLAIKGGACE